MCQLFINADSHLWSSRTKSLRIDGVVTSIRLEEFFWEILEEVVHRDSMTVGQMISKLYLESLDAEHDIGNFTSFLRVCCSRYLSLIADGQLERDENTPLGTVDAGSILEKEKYTRGVRRSRIGQ
ncbi:ribbon-helix-helix domain-containing protein [Oceanospirillum linum]|uniref:Intracellular proteinase I n=1 Tax=Oceanospirillum linum TaxID=966 RepID=A0A1T1HDY8_OCELI|nr:ribbon-helix-helix domain-containing protein [Oceanospirillum linum]OOV88022.1 intracellular proteinase I [Oceanospirillum linum]SEF40612.1 Predicted DNA-binding protein, contains Ribbon-helix-helix (RHH) domain [Oleiphilus messinensis]SMP00481.1 Predicted DNA-binding protein, contains Ribbon-helix-helix (RHH) domain [Oceanospirillum linum]